MNKFSEIRQDGILDDLKFMKSINYNPKKLNSDVWLKFGVNPQDEVGKRDKDEGKNFTTHPKMLSSDTDDTSAFSTPRRISVSSSASNVELIDNFAYEGNKLKIKDARKKLHQNLTQTKHSELCHLDVGIGDSSSVTPRGLFPEKRFQREKGKHVRIDSEVANKMRPNVLNIPSKKLGSTRGPLLQNSHRSGITESVFERKFKTFVEKSLHTISDIRSALERGVSQPDGDEDMSRRMVRVKEFSNRFSRNYLYPLARQMEDLIKLNPQNANLYQKLLSAYHVTLNGLQAYHNHLPTSIGTCSSNKLKELLKHILELCDIHNSFIKQPDDNGFSDFVSTYKLNAELTLKKIEEHFIVASTDSILKSVTTKLSLPACGATKMNKPKNKPKKVVDSRLSMYSITASFRKDPQWKKAVESFARKKLNVKSRYKTAAYRHRPPVERDPQILALPSNCKFFGKRSTAALKRTPITTPIQDDNITTMVQIENEKIVRKEKGGCAEGDARPNTSEPLNHEEIVVKLLQLVLDNTQRKIAEGEQQVRNDETASNDRQIADILERLRNEGNVDTLQKVLDALQNKAVVEPDELQLRIVKSHSSLEEKGVKKRKEPIITVTGEKNAKLICITDENSIIEAEDDSEVEIKNSQAEKVVTPKVTSSKTQTDMKKKSNKSTQRPTKNALTKMNRLPKSSKCLQLLPKNYAVNIIQYKLDFYKHCKMNPMYKKTTTLQPWMLMGKISDKLLDQALLSVAREIEVNDIVQQIYDSELQL